MCWRGYPMEIAAALMQRRQVTNPAGNQVGGPAQPGSSEVPIHVRVVDV
jgi:hypothetical protein